MYSCTNRTFGLQNFAQWWCGAAWRNLLPRPAPGRLAMCLIWARIKSAVAFGVAVVGVVPDMGSRVFEVAHVVRRGGLWPESLLRAGLSVALGVAATAGRVGTAAMGVLSPEITYNLLKLHRVALFLDLLQRTEMLSPEEAACPTRGIVSGQRWRLKTAWTTTYAVSQALGPTGRACLIAAIGKGQASRASRPPATVVSH